MDCETGRVVPSYAKVDLLAEVLATTSSGGSEPGSGPKAARKAAAVPEASGGEVVLTAGARFHLGGNWSAFAAASYDNQSAVGLRIGLTLDF